MSGTLIDEPVIAASRHRISFATDATTTGQAEAFVPPSTGTEDFPEHGTSVGRFKLWSSAVPQKDFWYLATHARNQLVHYADFEAHDERFDYSWDPAATEAASIELYQVLASWLGSWQVGEYAAEPPRGTVSLPYRRKVVFSEEIELDVQKLPRWQPFVTVDRRSAEANDE